MTQQLEQQLEAASTRKGDEARSIRNVDRTVKDLESQIQRREKQNSQLSDDVAKARDKISNLLATIDELQSSDSQSQLTAKRAERELREEREKALRLERELEGWKVMRMERGTGAVVHRSGTMAALSELAESQGRGVAAGSRAGSRKVSGVSSGGGAEGVHRKPSNTKGFL
jgi:myosin heavy chain 9/10/11/14